MSARARSSSEWERLEAAVLEPQARSARQRAAGGQPSVRHDATDDRVLERLAQRSRAVRGQQAPIGNVVFLHGITGSDLAVAEGIGSPNDVWVNIATLVRGGIAALQLAADGRQEANRQLRVRALGVNKRFYARAVLALRAHWNVEPFAYDWRKDIDAASDELAERIKRRFGQAHVHLVAHSMGGLVARNLIRRHPKLWESMRDPALEAGGRLVMLGTPNYGSYAIAQVLTGTDSLLKWLARFDLKHNLAELLTITNSFLGTYMLLPAYERLPVSVRGLYEVSTWGETPAISQRHLDRAFEFYGALDMPETLDGTRLAYVAGCNQVTISGIKIAGPGEFEYEFTRDGDGRVPHALGRLEGVPTWYVDEVHGDLARNERVLLALDELLQRGTAANLAREPVLRELRLAAGAAATGAATDAAPTLRSYRAAPERAGLEALAPLAERVRARGSDAELGEDQRQAVADALVHAGLGARTPTLVRAQARERAAPAGERVASRRGRLSLEVGVRFGYIEDFEAPIVIVGHYRGVKPVNAIGAIDAELRGWISRAVKRGMISGHVGETFFVPTRGTGVAAAAGVVIAGMGDYGTFGPASLQRIMANVAQGIAALRVNAAATVLVGAGEGSLDEETALRMMLEGFGAGLLELRAENADHGIAFDTLWIVECDPRRFTVLGSTLTTLVPILSDQGIDLRVVDTSPGDRRRAARAHERACRKRLTERPRGARQAFDEIRLTVEYDDEKERFHFSALTDDAVVAARTLAVPRKRIAESACALAEAPSRADQMKFGRLLFADLVPEEFDSLFGNGRAVRLIVDPTSAALPWEMTCLCTSRDGDTHWLGTDGCLTRQFRTLLSRTPGVIAPRSERIRALVIADPAQTPEWQLPGARAEGRLVAKLLRALNGTKLAQDHGVSLEVESRIGSAECDPIELRALLINGDFDLVHFAGHGDYRSDDPAQSGWVLDADHFVSAADIFRARRVPWLVVANACHSGAVRGSESYPSLEIARRGASIAEAFMERGVQNYLGTGWTVDDEQALLFADVFYTQLLQNAALLAAMKTARATLFAAPSGSTWGAYQLYGDPGDVLVAGLHEMSDHDAARRERRPPRRGKKQSKAKRERKSKSARTAKRAK